MKLVVCDGLFVVSLNLMRVGVLRGIVLCRIDVINVYNVYKKNFVNAFIILSKFISIKIT